MGLSAERLQDAVGLAAVHSGGLAVGGPTVPVARNLLCANTVRVGVDAALAASTGVAGPRELFAGARNFLTAFAGKGDAAALNAGLGQSWAILETSLKRWPCALQAQSALDALARLVTNRTVEAPVEALEIRLPEAMRRIVDRPGPPASRWGAAASLQFLSAALLLDGAILDSRLESGRTEPRLLELMQHIEVRSDPALDDRYPQEWPARVTLRDASGATTVESSLPSGHPARPLSFEFTEERFRQYAARRLPVEGVERALEFVRNLDRQRDVGTLVSLL
jgi:2-methylcitrate dehydratase PrpD